MARILKIASVLLLSLCCLGLVQLNLSLYHQATFETRTSGSIQVDVLHQLGHLKNKMHRGASRKMQRLFPEGFIFINALYGLTWAETIATLDEEDPIFQNGIKEINWTIAAMDSDYGKHIFSEKLHPTYGAFYNGWTNYLRGKKLALQAPARRDSLEIQHFQENCAALALAFQVSESPYLMSYSGAAWPADNLVCMAALSIHDQIFRPKFTINKQIWLEKVKARLDPETQLIPHSVKPNTGYARQGPRGSSQSLMNVFLLDIDKDFACEQFEIYRELFLDYRFGLPGIREYPKGKIGRGDVDSGPVILDVGGAASIVGIKAMALYGDRMIFDGLRTSVEGFGVAIDSGKKKRYLFGQLAMADAFIAWANASNPGEWHSEEMPCSFPHLHYCSNWRQNFQLRSLVLLFILMVLGRFIVRWKSTA